MKNKLSLVVTGFLAMIAGGTQSALAGGALQASSLNFNVDAGLINNNSQAEQVCPEICNSTISGMTWDGEWSTIKASVESVCQCQLPNQLSQSNTEYYTLSAEGSNEKYPGIALSANEILPCAAAEVLSSQNGDSAETVTFSNKLASSIDIYWINYSGVLEYYKTLQPGQSYVQDTYFTHPWVFTYSGTKTCLAVFGNSAPSFDGSSATVTLAPSSDSYFQVTYSTSASKIGKYSYTWGFNFY